MMIEISLPANRRPSGKVPALLIAVLMALSPLLSLGVLAKVDGAADATSIAAALDVQRVQLPTGPVFVLTLGVMAPGDQPAEFVFRTGQQYDFIVRQHGEELWRWSTGRAFHQAFHKQIFGAGTLHTFVQLWDGRDGEGRPVTGHVEIEGRLVTEAPIVARSVTFEVESSLPVN